MDFLAVRYSALHCCLNDIPKENIRNVNDALWLMNPTKPAMVPKIKPARLAVSLYLTGISAGRFLPVLTVIVNCRRQKVPEPLWRATIGVHANVSKDEMCNGAGP